MWPVDPLVQVVPRVTVRPYSGGSVGLGLYGATVVVVSTYSGTTAGGAGSGSGTSERRGFSAMQFDENSIVPSLICVAPVASEMHRTKYGSGGVSGLVLGVKSSDADELAACVTSVGGGVARGLVTIGVVSGTVVVGDGSAGVLVHPVRAASSIGMAIKVRLTAVLGSRVRIMSSSPLEARRRGKSLCPDQPSAPDIGGSYAPW